MKAKTSALDRLVLALEEREDGCIVFTGYLDKQGYGRIYHIDDKRLVHRVVYEVLVAPIPDGYEIDHLCFTRNCVNPLHLEAVTPWENTMRSSSLSAVNAAKTHCDNGHEFTPENTRHRRDRPGRTCRACDARRAAEYRTRREAA